MESDSAVLEQFGKSLREIITFTINQQRENATISRITKPNWVPSQKKLSEPKFLLLLSIFWKIRKIAFYFYSEFPIAY
jgi:hypothetical protein